MLGRFDPFSSACVVRRATTCAWNGRPELPGGPRGLPIGLSAEMRSSRSADVSLPQVPYGDSMKTSIEELVVFCSECEHSEFVHATREDQPCLFSDCSCSGFAGIAA